MPFGYTSPVSGTVDRSASGLVVAVGVATAATCAAIAAQALVFGSAAGRWVFPYVAAYRLEALAASVAVAIAAALLVEGVGRLAIRRPALAVLLAVAGATAVQLAAWRIYPYAPGAIVRSDAATSYFTAALRHAPAELLRAYDAIAPTLPLHAAGNMPGKLLLFRAMHAFTGSPDAMAVAIVILSSLVGAVVFAIADELFRDRAAATAALMLYLFLPCRLVFAPILNGVAPLPVAVALLAWVRYLRTGSVALPVAGGVALLAGVVFDPTPLALGLVFAAAALASRANGGASWGRIGSGVALTAAGFGVAWLVLRLATGFDALHQLARVAAEAERFNAWAGRPYATWLLPNLVEFFAAAGAPLVVVLAWGLRDRSSLAEPARWMAVAGLGTVLVVDLLGRNRGEVSRLWIFLCVPLAIAAGGALARSGRGPLRWAVAWLAFQGTTMLAVLGFVIP